MSMFLDVYAGCVEIRTESRAKKMGEHLHSKSMQICYGGRTVDVQPSIHLKAEMYDSLNTVLTYLNFKWIGIVY